MLSSFVAGFAVQYMRDKDELPDIKFTDDSVFSQVCDFITEHIDLNISSDATEEEILMEAMNQIESILQNTDYVEYTSVLQKAANGLSKDVSNAFDLLRNSIHNEVSALYEEISVKRDEYLKKAGADVLAKDSSPSLDFGIIKWENLRNLNYVQNLFEVVKNTTNVNASELLQSNVANVKNKLYQGGFNPIEISEDIRTKLIDDVDKVLSTRNKEEISEAIGIFLKPTRYNGYCNNLNKRMSLGNNVDEDMVFVMDRISLVRDIAKGLNDVQLNLSEDTLNKIRDNIKKVDITSTLGEYFLLFCKEKIYKGKLIINENLINNDELNKFSRDGGKLEDIAYYLKLNYGERQIPVGGISTTSVIENKAKLQQGIEEHNAKIKSKSRMLMSKSLTSAYMHVMNNYLKDIEDSRLPEGISKDDFYKHNYHLINITMNQLHGKDNNIEDALYTFILALFYRGTIVQNLYTYMGKEYPKLLQQYDSVDEDDVLKLVDNYVVATLVSEYLTKGHCK